MSDVDCYIGNKLYERRKLLGMNQEAMGKRVGVSFQQMQKYEKGLNGMSIGRLLQFSAAMNVPFTYFVQGYLNEEGKADTDTLEGVANFYSIAEANEKINISIINHLNNIENGTAKAALAEHIEALNKALVEVKNEN